MKSPNPKRSSPLSIVVPTAALSALLAALAFLFGPSPAFGTSGINSGGAESQIGALTNSSSLGAPFIADPSTAAHSTNRSGSIEVLFAEATEDYRGDTDRDGLPDDWESTHGLSTSSANADADPDGDGFTNLEEYILGSDPNDAASSAALTIFTHNGLLQPVLPSLEGRTYELLVSPDLSTFQSWTTKQGTGSALTFVFDPQSAAVQQAFGTPSPSTFFFKVSVSLSE